MTRGEAINAMKAGKKVTHRNFSADEWIGMVGDATIVDEDGYHFTAKAFWEDRQDSMWEIGWRVVEGM